MEVFALFGVIILMFIYFYMTLNSLDKKLNHIEETIQDNDDYYTQCLRNQAKALDKLEDSIADAYLK